MKGKICIKCGAYIEPGAYHNCIEEINAFNRTRERTFDLERRVERLEKIIEQHIRKMHHKNTETEP